MEALTTRHGLLQAIPPSRTQCASFKHMRVSGLGLGYCFGRGHPSLDYWKAVCGLTALGFLGMLLPACSARVKRLGFMLPPGSLLRQSSLRYKSRCRLPTSVSSLGHEEEFLILGSINMLGTSLGKSCP